MRIIVIGAAGRLGSALVRELANRGADVIPFTRAELDICDRAAVSALGRTPADVIVNCSAYNAVDEAERCPDVAMAVNAHAVQGMADVANRSRAILVHFSSDFVFDGFAHHPYTERDVPNPIGAYGRSKLEGERQAMLAERSLVLRLASVFGGGPRHQAVPDTTIDRMINRTLVGDTVTAFSDRTVTPSYVPDVIDATWRLLTMPRVRCGLYHCVASEAATWSMVAREVAALLKKPDRVRDVLSSEVVAAARRPVRCALSNGKLAAVGIVMPSWRDTLSRHIAAVAVASR